MLPRELVQMAVLVLAFASFLPAQDASEVGGTVDEKTGTYDRVQFELPQVEADIKIDAVLDDAAWAQALVIQLNYETRPGENTKPPVDTECRILSTLQAIYYGCHAKDPEPEKIRARYTDRDKSFGDDTIGVVFDTFNDQNIGFTLDVNPLGVQNDRTYIEATGRIDFSWDAIWESAGRLTADGYMVEAKIPFSSLRFPGGGERRTWGFNFRRFMPRDVFRRIATVPYNRDDRCRTCQHAELSGFENIDAGLNLEITPTLTGVQNASRDDFPNGPLETESADFDLGLTANWGVTPNMTLAATLNPDFSQVEADIAQLEINEEFALFFPERRPFFLEGSDYFNTDLRVVNTRSVADPDWGIKLTGKQGKNAIGVFASRDATTNLLLPGPESSGVDNIDKASDVAVLRYRRDVAESSTVGALFTDRSSGDYSNQVAGLDARLRLTSNDSLDLQWLSSRTEYPGEVAEANDLSTGVLEDHALSARYRHSTRNWNVRAALRDIGDDFRADLGFMPRVGFKQLVVGGGYQWFGDDDKWYTSTNLGGDWDRTESQQGELLEEEWEFFAGWQGTLQSSFFFGGGVRDRVFDSVLFEQEFGFVSFNMQPRREISFGIDIDGGDGIDFAEVRAGDRLSVSPYLEIRPGQHLSAELFHNYRNLDLPEGRLFTADLTELRLIYQFNRRSFVRLITQTSRIKRNQALYTDEVTPLSKDIFGQLLYSYKVNAQTALFLGYTAGYADLDDTRLVESGNTLFIKVGYNWQP